MAENIFPYELPANWQWATWGQCGKFIAGFGFKKEYQGLKNYEIPFYKVGSLKFSNSQGYIQDKDNTINKNILKILKAQLIPKDSLLFAKIGEAIRLNRRALNNVPCCIDNNMIAFISEKILPRYVYYWSQSIDLYIYTNATTVPKELSRLSKVCLRSWTRQNQSCRKFLTAMNSDAPPFCTKLLPATLPKISAQIPA